MNEILSLWWLPIFWSHLLALYSERIYLHIYATADSEQNYIHSIYRHSPIRHSSFCTGWRNRKNCRERRVLLPHNHVIYFVLLKNCELHEIVEIPILSLPVFTCCNLTNLKGTNHLTEHVGGSEQSICAEIPTNWRFTDNIQIPTNAFFKPSRPKQASWHIFRKQRFPLKMEICQ